MTSKNITERLRASVHSEQLAEQPGQQRPNEEYLSWQAADEITRLTAEVGWLQNEGVKATLAWGDDKVKADALAEAVRKHRNATHSTLCREGARPREMYVCKGCLAEAELETALTVYGEK